MYIWPDRLPDWLTGPLPNLPSTHPGFLEADIVADVNGETSFKDGAFSAAEQNELARRVWAYKWSMQALKVADREYQEAILTGTPKSKDDAIYALSLRTNAMRSVADRLREQVALMRLTSARRAALNATKVPRDVVDFGRALGVKAIDMLGPWTTGKQPGDDWSPDNLRRAGKALRSLFTGPVSSLPGGPGLSGWMSDLNRSRTPVGGKSGGTVVAVANGPGPSASTNTNTGKTSTPDGASSGAGYGAFERSQGQQEGGLHVSGTPVVEAEPIYTLTVTGKVGPFPEKGPNPVEGAASLSKDPFVAALQLKALGFAGRAISTPNGPVLAFTPDAGGSPTDDTSGTIDWETLDPVAPYAGGQYEPSGRPRGQGPARRGSFQNPYIEALYPEGSGPGAEEDDDTLAAISTILTPRAPIPQPEVGNPEAGGGPRVGATITAVSNGLMSRTIDFAAGRVRAGRIR